MEEATGGAPSLRGGGGMVLVEEKKRGMEQSDEGSDEDSLSTAPGSWLDPRHV